MDKNKLYKKLEILLVTYNRDVMLDRTLKQFLASPFNKCKFTILDNCSTDNTPTVCNKYKKLFSNFNILRHKKNIGGGSNYLRAVEIAEADYAWIICDDDLYDFSDCDDIIKVIESGKHDLISVGNGSYKFNNRGISSTTVELVNKNEMYYSIHAFIPSLIFKTKLFTSECIIKANFMQKDIFPQLYFAHFAVLNNMTIYISHNEILQKDDSNVAININPFFQFSSWVASCSIITDKRIRQRTIYEYFHNKKLLLITKLIYYIYYEKVLTGQGRLSFGKEGLFAKFLVLCNGFTGFQLGILILLIPLFIIPSSIFKVAGNILFHIYYKGKIPLDKKSSSKIDPRL